MSQLTASTLLPFFAALPAEEQAVFVEKINSLVQKRNKPSPRKRTTMDKVADQLGEEFRDGNEEMFVSKIMYGNY